MFGPGGFGIGASPQGLNILGNLPGHSDEAYKQFMSLGKPFNHGEYVSWLGSRKSAGDAYASYLKLKKENPGRKQTILMPENPAVGAVLGEGMKMPILGA